MYINLVNIFRLTKQRECCADYKNISGRCEGTRYYFSLLFCRLYVKFRPHSSVYEKITWLALLCALLSVSYKKCSATKFYLKDDCVSSMY